MNIKYLIVWLVMISVFVGQGVAGNAFIKSIKFDNLALPQVVKRLQQDYQVNLVLQASKKELAETPLIDLQLERIPLYTLIYYICMLSDMAYEIDGELLLIGRRLEKSIPLRTERFKPDPLAGIPPGTRMTIGSTYYMPIAWSPAKTVVTGNTVTYISPVPTEFLAQNTGVSFGQDDTAADMLKVKPEVKVKSDKPEYRKLRWRHRINNLTITNRLRRKVVALELNDVSLKEAIATIRQLSTTGSGKNKKSINFIIMPFPEMDKVKVSCYFNSLNLLSSLKYICKAAKVKYQIDKHAVIIYRTTAKKKK
ncbi:MAG: hypothetical protein L3J71_18120 [Victivallaceae bacterium]|nr:hypothetical protein [Victivallaceae bacterium]